MGRRRTRRGHRRGRRTRHVGCGLTGGAGETWSHAFLARAGRAPAWWHGGQDRCHVATGPTHSGLFARRDRARLIHPAHGSSHVVCTHRVRARRTAAPVRQVVHRRQNRVAGGHVGAVETLGERSRAGAVVAGAVVAGAIVARTRFTAVGITVAGTTVARKPRRAAPRPIVVARHAGRPIVASVAIATTPPLSPRTRSPIAIARVVLVHAIRVVPVAAIPVALAPGILV